METIQNKSLQSMEQDFLRDTQKTVTEGVLVAVTA